MLPNLGQQTATGQQGLGGYYTPDIWNKMLNTPMGQGLPTITKTTPQATTGGGGYYSPGLMQGIGKLPAGAGNGVGRTGAGTDGSGGTGGFGVSGGIGSRIPQGAGGGTGAGGAKPKTWRDVGHEQINSKLGAGWAENFQKAHNMSPLDFYSNPNNFFSYQRDALQDYGADSKEFANATIRATIEEGIKHGQEAALWREKHGDTAIPPEMWEHWFYVNRGMTGPDTPIVW